MKFLATLLFCISLYAGLIDGVAVIVGDRPITLYEIDKISTQYNISQNDAVICL